MHSIGTSQFEQAVDGMGNQRDTGTGVTTATWKPVCTSPKTTELSFGMVILINVVLGRWYMMALDSGSETETSVNAAINVRVNQVQ